MLTIKGPSEAPCFMTGKTGDCYVVNLKDESFKEGVLCWEAIHGVLKRKFGNDSKKEVKPGANQCSAKNASSEQG